MAGVPYTFATATTSIPLSQLDANFNTPVTIGSTTVGLGNTTTTLAGLSNVSTTLLVATTANVTTTNLTNLTVTNDASISGLTVGKGLGSQSSNTAVGNGALGSNTSGNTNSAFGFYSLISNTTGSSNSSYGYTAMQNNTTGSNNIAFGHTALFSNTTASNNTAVGFQAGYNITTGAQNTCIGYQTGLNITTTFNGLYVGNTINSSAATGVINEVVIGVNYGSTIVGKGSGTGFIVAGAGGVYQGNNSATWSITSDQRLKKNIVDNTQGLSKILPIQVRNFEYRLPEEITEVSPDQAISKSGVQLGAIAQELQQILPECVKQESTGIYTVDADPLIWYLVNAVKELNAKITALENK